MIPYGRQSITDAEIEAVIDVMRSDCLTQGERVPAFEKALADYCDVEHAVALANGTAALHLACVAIDMGPGDLLWTTANTFVASANCARYCGADVDFVDIDPATRNLSIEALQQKLQQAERAGRLPKALVAVHFAGLSCDMQALAELAGRYRFRVIEDASHAIGSRYQQQPVGSCRYSDMTVFSFHPVKNMTAGEGGAITCRNSELANRIEKLRHHGVVRDAEAFQFAPDGPCYYEQQQLGFNYRLTDIQAAIAEVQLKRLPEFVEARQVLVNRYQEAFADLPLSLPVVDGQTAWHIYVVEFSDASARQHGFDVLQSQGIASNIHYRPVHLQPYYRQLGFEPGYCPAAERYAQRALSLPLYPGLAHSDQDRVIAAVKASLNGGVAV